MWAILADRVGGDRRPISTFCSHVNRNTERGFPLVGSCRSQVGGNASWGRSHLIVRCGGLWLRLHYLPAFLGHGVSQELD